MVPSPNRGSGAGRFRCGAVIAPILIDCLFHIFSFDNEGCGRRRGRLIPRADGGWVPLPCPVGNAVGRPDPPVTAVPGANSCGGGSTGKPAGACRNPPVVPLFPTARPAGKACPKPGRRRSLFGTDRMTDSMRRPVLAHHVLPVPGGFETRCGARNPMRGSPMLIPSRFRGGKVGRPPPPLRRPSRSKGIWAEERTARLPVGDGRNAVRAFAVDGGGMRMPKAAPQMLCSPNPSLPLGAGIGGGFVPISRISADFCLQMLAFAVGDKNVGMGPPCGAPV